MKREQKNISKVFLAGGLGNQLFQFACALSTNPQAKNVILHGEKIPDLLEFKLPIRIQFSSFQNVVDRKLLNLVLRQTGKNKIDSKVNYLSMFIIKFVFHRTRFRNWNLVIPRGIGFDEKITPKNTRTIFMGYFQSYKWLINSETLKSMRMIALLEESQWLDQIHKLADEESPIVVQIRRGDYLKEGKFGILDYHYFLRGISELKPYSSNSKIWIFTDDEEYVKETAPDGLVANARFVSAPNGSAAMTLEAMRFGKNYVISNSTFGWWGAFLSHNESAKVVCPVPWFSEIPEPCLIVPPDWIRISRN